MRALPPRITFCGLRGSSGKTTVTLGVVAALRECGVAVAPFKKGPDYIDPAWLSQAAGNPCRNLDTFLVEEGLVRRWFAATTAPGEVAVIEGNRGLFDGVDVTGTHSTAELAKLIESPVIIVLDCTKVSRTAAAMILGCQQLDPDCNLAGVILNRVARPRHESILRDCVESVCGLPVLGAIPKLRHSHSQERHLGLVPPQEHSAREAVIAEACQIARAHLDLDRLVEIARATPACQATEVGGHLHPPVGARGLRVGVLRDSVFQFYYPENLEALGMLGAEVTEIDSLVESELPAIRGLYVGGGFPETQIEALADNSRFRQSVRDAVEAGLPVFAECGGLMYLGEELRVAGKSYPMVGALPLAFEMTDRPQGHGYTILDVVTENPYFAVGARVRGHEFHYSRASVRSDKVQFAFNVSRGTGIDGSHDGVVHRNVVASYAHFHALGVRDWAKSFVTRAVEWQAQ